jgi:hypothetical protein
MAQRRGGGPRQTPSGDRRLAEEFDLALSGAAAGGSRSRGSGYGGTRGPRSYGTDEWSYDESSYDGVDNGARRQPSPATPAATHINALVTVARRVEDAGTALPGMDEAFRARLRERLVRLTPELAAPPAKAQLPGQRGGRHAGLRRPAGARPSHTGAGFSTAWRRRLLAASVGVAVATGSVGGIAIASAGSVPGDPLYSAKKMFENIQLSLSGSPTDRGGQYLRLADTRLGEIDALLSRRDADAPGSPTAAYLDQDLTDLQAMIGDGGNLLLDQVRAQGDQQAMHLLADFLLTERQRVADLTWQLPLTLQDRPAQIVALMDNLYRQLQQVAAAIPPNSGDPAPTPSAAPQPGTGSGGPGVGNGSAQSNGPASTHPGASSQHPASHGVSPSGQPSAGASGSTGPSPSASTSASPSSSPTIGLHLPLPILPSIGVDLPPLLGLPGIDLGLGGSGGSDPSATPSG